MIGEDDDTFFIVVLVILPFPKGLVAGLTELSADEVSDALSKKLFSIRISF